MNGLLFQAFKENSNCLEVAADAGALEPPAGAGSVMDIEDVGISRAGAGGEQEAASAFVLVAESCESFPAVHVSPHREQVLEIP